ncbi:hypothetical protein DSL64_12790 [Dyadobacter luteus]|jgi:fatty acid desaturase|uniref:DUF2752 domain-containing protein n=1 Tax=Dyadobacter luteus TaxID=2259619 RepID=A0A3D8YEL7_9BACT|nr:hypothetical protein DSL64_12790 [Dyadobacter luteus]
MIPQDHLIRRLIISVTVLATVTWYYMFDPAEHSSAPPCLLHKATGWLCWGCGGQRAFHQLLHGHFHSAFQLNALVYPVTCILIYITVSELIKNTPTYSFFRNKMVAVSALLILIGFTLLRNI